MKIYDKEENIIPDSKYSNRKMPKHIFDYLMSLLSKPEERIVRMLCTRIYTQDLPITDDQILESISLSKKEYMDACYKLVTKNILVNNDQKFPELNQFPGNFSFENRTSWWNLKGNKIKYKVTKQIDYDANTISQDLSEGYFFIFEIHYILYNMGVTEDLQSVIDALRKVPAHIKLYKFYYVKSCRTLGKLLLAKYNQKETELIELEKEDLNTIDVELRKYLI